MTRTAPARSTARRIRIRWGRVIALLAALVAIAAVLVEQPPASSPGPAVDAAPTSASPPRADGPALGDVGGSVAGLDRKLLRALREAAAAAAHDGVTLSVTSGRRTPEHQAELLREAVVKYGSEQEAARWVARPNTSAHVSGDAVDVGPDAAIAWLSEHGAAYGLCQIYANEPWHYERRRDAAEQGCPALYPDPTHDPRMYR